MDITLGPTEVKSGLLFGLWHRHGEIFNDLDVPCMCHVGICSGAEMDSFPCPFGLGNYIYEKRHQDHW